MNLSIASPKWPDKNFLHRSWQITTLSYLEYSKAFYVMWTILPLVDVCFFNLRIIDIVKNRFTNFTTLWFTGVNHCCKIWEITYMFFWRSKLLLHEIVGLCHQFLTLRQSYLLQCWFCWPCFSSISYMLWWYFL